jgi:hypothetical protein
VTEARRNIGDFEFAVRERVVQCTFSCVDLDGIADLMEHPPDSVPLIQTLWQKVTRCGGMDFDDV